MQKYIEDVKNIIAQAEDSQYCLSLVASYLSGAVGRDKDSLVQEGLSYEETEGLWLGIKEFFENDYYRNNPDDKP